MHTVAKTSVQTGMEGVLGPSEAKQKELAEIEKLKQHKRIVKTP